MTKDSDRGMVLQEDHQSTMSLFQSKRHFKSLLLGGCLLIVANCGEGQDGTTAPVKNPDTVGTGGSGAETGRMDAGTGGSPPSTGWTTDTGVTNGSEGGITPDDNPMARPPDGEMPPIEIPGDPDALPAQSCKVTEKTLPREPAEVLILLDRSTSLGEQENNSANSWWVMTTKAMNQGIKSSESMVDWGLMLFPKGTDSKKCCIMPANDLAPQVEVEIAPQNAKAIAESLSNTEPSGVGTPTAKALLQGANYLRTRTTNTQKYIILLTDGDPTCVLDNVCKNQEDNDYTRTKETIAHITSVFGIPVAIIGIAYPNSSSELKPNSKQLHLIDLAKLGGIPNKSKGQPAYYIATTQAELQDSFKSLYSKTVSCSYATGLSALWDGDAAVDLQGKNIARDPSHEEGWDFGDGGKTVVFYGRACSSILQSTETLKPRLRLGCPNSSLE
jgi:hypothetical protein